MKKLLALLCLVVSFSASAVAWDKNTDFLWNATTGRVDISPGPGTGYVWYVDQMKPSAFGPTVNRQKALPFNPSPTANFKATFTPAKIAKALMNPSSAIITLAGAAILNRILDEACVRVFGGGMQISPGGQWEECKYSPQVQDIYWPVGHVEMKSSSPDAAAAKYWTSLNSSNSTATTTYTPVSCTSVAPFTCTANKVVCYPDYGCGNPTVSSIGLNKNTETVQVKDGYKPITNLDLEPKFTGVLDQWSQADFLYGKEGLSGDASQVLDKIMQSGNAVDIESFGITFPSTLPGTTTSTTTGDVTTTTTTTNNYAQAPNGPVDVKVTHTVSSNVTTINNVTGATTNVSSSTKTGEDAVDPCAKEPDRVGCLKSGTAPEAEAMRNTDHAVAIDPVMFNSLSICPQPLNFSVMGHSYAVSYTPLCDKLAVLRMLFLLMAGMVAAYIFTNSFRV